MASSDDWKSSGFRQNVTARIEEAIRQSGNPVPKTASEMETHFFQRATNKEEYLSYFARLLTHINELGNNKHRIQGGVSVPWQANPQQHQQGNLPQGQMMDQMNDAARPQPQLNMLLDQQQQMDQMTTMTTKVETSPLLALKYEWKITGIDQDESQIFSKKFMHQKTDLFQAGMKMQAATHLPSNPAVLFLLTTILQKMGLKMLAVSYYESESDSRKYSEMQEMNLNDEVEKGSGIQLFTAPLKLLKKHVKQPLDFTFHFTIYLTGIVDNYRVRQKDGLLSRQLWSSVTDQQDDGADFNLIANDGKSLPVHKWVLAARSPVFAVFFSKEEGMKSVHHAVDCTADEMKQFIKFIYTGKLEGLVSHKLMHLAATYEIKTLKELCQSAFQDAYTFTCDKLAMIALHLECGSHPICLNNEADKNDVELFAMKNVTNISLFTCSWNVQDLCKKKRNQTKIKTTVPFELEGKKLFRAELEMIENPNEEKHQGIKLKFLSYGHSQMCCSVHKVSFSIAQDQNNFNNQRLEMHEAPTYGADLFQVFKKDFPIRLIRPLIRSFSIHFHVKLRSTVLNYINKPLDSTWSGELWAAAVNRKMTDVEFLVGEVAFGAHRSLLSARSPVFAAMFSSGMKEAATGRVRIEDVDPTTFQRFLKFLYTGMLEFTAMDNKELLTVADKYQVSTLVELCRPATQPVDNGAFLKTFLSC